MKCIVPSCTTRAREKYAESGSIKYYTFPLSVSLVGACQRSAWITKLGTEMNDQFGINSVALRGRKYHLALFFSFKVTNSLHVHSFIHN